MSSLPADIIIWILLFTGAIFSGFGLMGLLIFPDTRSRMFTAFRATAIGLGAVALSVIVYGFALLSETGSSVYPGLILQTLLLVLVLAAGTWMMYGIIHKKTQKRPAGTDQTAASPATSKKDGE
jgi:multisubunit Na+/H+ antiporter MnhG subunit